MTTHSKIYSHTEKHNDAKVASRFWNDCARMLSVIAISAAATGSAYAALTGAGNDNTPEVDTYLGTAPAAYANAYYPGPSSVAPLQLPTPVGTASASSALYFSISSAFANILINGVALSDGSSVNAATPNSLAIAGVGTFSSIAHEPAPLGTSDSQAIRNAASIGANGGTQGALYSFLPAPGFFGTVGFNYNVYDALTSTNGSAASVYSGSSVLSVLPAVRSAPTNGNTNTLTTSGGSGVLLVTGLGKTVMSGNTGDHTGTGGAILDGGKLTTPGWSTSVPVRGMHGSELNGTGNLTLSKLIIG